MRAAWYDQRGEAQDVLQTGDLPMPTPQSGEVLIRIHASGVNPSDTKARRGLRSRNSKFSRVIPHQDGAGVIEAVGAGVDSARIGQRVWVYEAQLGRAFGTGAEYTTVPSINAVPLPDGISFQEGACLGVPAITAHYCVTADGPVADQVILIHGGGGCVAFYAIQIAKLEGAYVITTVRTKEHARNADIAGADHIIFREEEDVEARVAAITTARGCPGVDRIIDVAFGANLPLSVNILKPNGVIATYASDTEPTPELPFHKLAALNATVRFVLVYALSAQQRALSIAAITRALESNLLKHMVGPIYPLSQIVEAHVMVETGKQSGKVIIQMK